MLSKPLSIALVYILVVINLMVLFSPFIVAIYPFISLEGEMINFANYISFNPKILFFAIIFIISFLMLCYLFMDFVFGFTIKTTLKNCKRYDKIKDFNFLEKIFNEVKTKFRAKSVKLYINFNNEINAFAIGGVRKKAIILTTGLINHYAKYTSNEKEFLIAIRSILAHEMSHLINKDYLPGFIIIVNQKITNLISSFIMSFFHLIIKISTIFRLNTQLIAATILYIYNIIDWILTFFNRYIIYNIYEFIRKFISRNIEYRCDLQAAKAFGGYNMAFALSLLGKSGYFTLFSSHPATARRIKKVEMINIKKSTIGPNFITYISNFLAIIILPLICLYAAHLSKIDLILKFYLYHNYPEIYYDLLSIIGFIKNFLSQILEKIQF